MKRQRRTFSNQFKTEVATSIINDKTDRELIAKQHDLPVPLINRWVNDHIATSRSAPLFPKVDLTMPERRKDYQSTIELKTKIADLYMQLEKLTKLGSIHSDKLQLSRS